jgi:biopolymer transport protein ExbB
MVMIRRRAARFLESFWNAPSMQAVALRLAERGSDEPFSRLSQRAIAAARASVHRVGFICDPTINR